MLTSRIREIVCGGGLRGRGIVAVAVFVVGGAGSLSKGAGRGGGGEVCGKRGEICGDFFGGGC